MTESAWLIEAPGQFYLRAGQVGHSWEFKWTDDANQALRFASQQQADATMMAVRQLSPALFDFARTLRDAHAIEHGFLTTTADGGGDGR